MGQCPCGSLKSYEECCELYITGKENAPTAEATMRARYSAFAMSEIDFIVSSNHSETREDLNREELKAWSSKSDWESLEVVSTEKGLGNDSEGTVEFIAYYAVKGKSQKHHEIASFKKEDGFWFFVDGELQGGGTVYREGPKVGRNDPCPCGSGRKYKKCCLK